MNPGYDMLVNKIQMFVMIIFHSILLRCLKTFLIAPFDMHRYGDGTRVGSATGRTPKQQMVATFRQMMNGKQILIAPLTVWTGIEQAFLSADFTAVNSFVCILINYVCRNSHKVRFRIQFKSDVTST